MRGLEPPRGYRAVWRAAPSSGGSGLASGLRPPPSGTFTASGRDFRTFGHGLGTPKAGAAATTQTRGGSDRGAARGRLPACLAARATKVREHDPNAGHPGRFWNECVPEPPGGARGLAALEFRARRLALSPRIFFAESTWRVSVSVLAISLPLPFGVLELVRVDRARSRSTWWWCSRQTVTRFQASSMPPSLRAASGDGLGAFARWGRDGRQPRIRQVNPSRSRIFQRSRCHAFVLRRRAQGSREASSCWRACAVLFAAVPV